MRVILKADHPTLGHRGDVVEVKAGYARNYLLPKSMAIPATRGAVRQAEEMRRARHETERRAVEEARQLAERIGKTPIRIIARAGDEGLLFGSVTNADVAEKLSQALSAEVDRRKVHVEAIRSLGVHSYEVHLHPEVDATGTLEVVAD
jgi:large subunit ribosomal protein L9